MKKYFIGQGTSIIKEFNTKNEMIEFHKNMDQESRHFCKLYDREEEKITDGWRIYNNYNKKEVWREW